MEEKNKEVKENKKEQVKNIDKVEETKKEELKTENKKFEVKNEKEKMNNWIGKTIVVAIVVIIAALLTFMIVKSSDPKKSVDGFLTNLKAGDFEKAQQFVSGEKLL